MLGVLDIITWDVNDKCTAEQQMQGRIDTVQVDCLACAAVFAVLAMYIFIKVSSGRLLNIY
jgi:hypothetical protein